MSPELLRMAKRAALPIHVSFDPDCETLFVGRYVDSVFCIAAGGVYLDSAEATAAYFALCESLTPNPDTSPSLVSGAGDCSVSSPPGTR